MDKQIKELKEQTAGSGVDVDRSRRWRGDPRQSARRRDLRGRSSTAISPGFQSTRSTQIAEQHGPVSQQPDRRVWATPIRPGRTTTTRICPKRRAEAVADYLVMRGVSRARIATQGYGEQYPVADNATDDRPRAQPPGRNQDHPGQPGRRERRSAQLMVCYACSPPSELLGRAMRTPSGAEILASLRSLLDARWRLRAALRTARSISAAPARSPAARPPRAWIAGALTSSAESARIALVVGQRLAERVGHRRARLARDQGGGGDVPFEAPAQRGHQIGLVGGDHRDPQRDRIGLVDHHQIAVVLAASCRPAPARRQIPCAAGLRAARHCATRPARRCRTTPRLARRRGEHPDQRTARADQRDRHRPARPPADEIARAVDRIDQPDQALAQPLGMRRRFLPTASRPMAAARAVRAGGKRRLPDRLRTPGCRASLSQLFSAWPAPRPARMAICPASRTISSRRCRSIIDAACQLARAASTFQARSIVLMRRQRLRLPQKAAKASLPMNIHEYQAKELLAKFGIGIPAGHRRADRRRSGRSRRSSCPGRSMS